MKYVDTLEVGRREILSRFPELENATFTADGSGWANFAIKVGGEYLFRFPRDDEAYGCIQAECEVLNKLKPQVPNYLGEFLDQDYPFVFYRMIQGRPLTHELWNSLDKEKRENFVANLAEFLEILHGINPADCKIDTIQPLENYQKRYQEFRERCFPYLDEQEKYAAEKLFNNYLNDPEMYRYQPAVVHHDLSENHILLTEDGIGIIDFGDVVIFDPAMDFSGIYAFSLDLYQKLYNQYHGNNKDGGFTKRIHDFYVPIIPFYGVVYGEETHNKQLLNQELKNLKTVLAQIT